MGTKQIQMLFQVAPNNGVSLDLTVAIDGVQKFSGQATKTVDAIVSGNIEDTSEPNFAIEFDQVVGDQGTYPGEPTAILEYTSATVSITINGGNAALQYQACNYNGQWAQGESNLIIVPGDAVTFQEVKPNTQPTWNGVAIPNRYNLQANDGTGMGALVILNGETLAYEMQIPNYIS